MATMTLAEAHEYVWQAEQAESEQRAEYGSGCVSLGYDPGEWAVAYEGYRTSADPDYAEAKRLLRDRYELVRVIRVPSAAEREALADSIPF